MIDARGFSCPIPVVMVQKAVNKDHPKAVDVKVDAMVCVENITRFANSSGYSTAYEEQDGEFTIHLEKNNA